MAKTMKTYSMKASEVHKDWVVVDATGQTLGRLASRVAAVLQGKHKPTYSPNMDMGDFVIVTNAQHVKVTGAKLDDKIYVRHTGYVGGLKETPLRDMLQKNPQRVIEMAVRGMLPRNNLAKHVLRHLKVYPGAEHPHEAQVNGSKNTAEAIPALAGMAAAKTEKSA
jgi:large subunit ribosomal protein L13